MKERETKGDKEMKKIWFVFFALLVATFAAEAKQTTLQVADNGLLGAMKRMGCSAQALSVVMRGNGILESELTSLPRDMKIFIPDECSGRSISRRDRQITARIFQHQHALARAREVEKMLEESQDRERYAIRDLAYANENLRVAKENLDKKIAELHSVRLHIPQIQKQYLGWGIVLGMILVPVVFGLMMVAGLRRRLKFSWI